MAYQDFIKNKQLSDFIRYGVVALIIGAIAILFPRYNQSQYRYSLGDKWAYDDLFASQAFDVSRTDEELILAREQAAESIPLVFSSAPFSKTNMANDLLSALEIDRIEGTFNQELTTFVNNSIKKGIIANTIRYDDNTEFKLKRNGSKLKSLDSENIKTQSEFLAALKVKFESVGLTLPSSFTTDDIPVSLELNEEVREQLLQKSLSKLTSTKASIKKGQIIVAAEEKINERIYDTLNSYFAATSKSQNNTRSPWLVFMGYVLLTCLIIGALLLYLRKYFNNVYLNTRTLLFILIWPLIFAYAVFLIEDKTNLSTYVIPFCIVPIIVKNFYQDRLALFTHIVVILIASFLSREGYQFTFIQILAGVVTVLVVDETRFFNLFFKAIGFIFLSYALCYLGLNIITHGNLMEIDWAKYGSLIFNALLLLLAYPLIPMLEKLFGFISSITLAELADLNKPLLKELTIKAPGTFQHSLQVANLAEAATEKIGGDSLLVKVAAMYHDVGKISAPQNFIENQGNDANPHDSMNNFESAKAIIDHVTNGITMAQKAGLPKKLIEFIKTHHGTTRVEYFYRNQLKDHPEQEFDEGLFRYPGPKPSTKEQAILMIADSLEAASKSLKNPTGQDIDKLVDGIIAGKIAHGQLEETQLSFQELEICKSTFKNLLRSINHVRVEYPDEKK